MLTVRAEHGADGVSVHEGTALACEGGRVSVLFEQPVSLGRVPVELQYMAGGGQIVAASADALPRSKDQPASRGEFQLREGCSRPIAARASALVCDTPEEDGCAVMRFSPERITIRTSSRPSPGDRLHLTLRAGDDRVTSVFVVSQRNVSHGAVSVELQAEPGDRAMRSWLADRIGVPGRRGASASGDGARPSASNSHVPTESEIKDGCIQLNIPVKDLVGKSLPFEVLDERGEVIAGPSAVIEEGDLERLAGTRAFPKRDWLDVFGDNLVPEGKELDGDERRAFPRYAFRPKGVAQVVGDTDRRKLQIQMVDVSRSGLSFRTNAHIAPGTPLMVLIETRGGKYWILSRAVHCRVDPRKGFRVGVKYEQSELNSLDRVA
jgi:hypothetical protein